MDSRTRSNARTFGRVLLFAVPVVLVTLAIWRGVTVSRGSSSAPRRASNSTAEDRPGIRVKDMAGRWVELDAPAHRIILVRGREVHLLGLLLGQEIEDKLIAWGPDIDTADHVSFQAYIKAYPKLRDVPFIGSIYSDSINVEYLLSLDPDLVVVDNFMVRRGYKSIERMQQAGLPLLFTENGIDPLTGPQASLRILAAALGKAPLAEEISQFIEQELAKVYDGLARIPSSDSVELDSRTSIYMECGNRGVGRFGHTWGLDEKQEFITWGKYMDELKLNNIAAGRVPDRTPVHPEWVLQTDPDLIILTGSSWENAQDCMLLGLGVDPGAASERLSAFTSRPGWTDLQAVKHKRMHAIFHNDCIHPTSFVAFQHLAKWAYPDAFDDLDPDANRQAFFKRFGQIDYEGTWHTSLE